MAQVALNIAGRSYEVACRDGEEARLTALAAIVDEKAVQAGRALGGVNEARQLLLASLLLADDLGEARKGTSPAQPAAPAEPAAPAWSDITPLLNEIADRLERIAAKLEPGEDA